MPSRMQSNSLGATVKELPSDRCHPNHTHLDGHDLLLHFTNRPVTATHLLMVTNGG